MEKAMAGWTTGSREVNGIDVHYLRTGGHKPPIVLLHGLMTNGACWTPLAQALEKDYDVVMPDARGHGNSGAPDHAYLYDDLAADVVSLIDARTRQTAATWPFYGRHDGSCRCQSEPQATARACLG